LSAHNGSPIATDNIGCVSGDEAQCARCLEFEEEVRRLEQRLAAGGQFVTYSPGPNISPNLEHEQRRWLATSPRADAAAGFRAG
jgi:hypothetical protein